MTQPDDDASDAVLSEISWIVHGAGKPGLLALTAFPPGPREVARRVADRDAAAPGAPREVATCEGVCDVMPGGVTKLPEGPFAPPAPR